MSDALFLFGREFRGNQQQPRIPISKMEFRDCKYYFRATPWTHSIRKSVFICKKKTFTVFQCGKIAPITIVVVVCIWIISLQSRRIFIWLCCVWKQVKFSFSCVFLFSFIICDDGRYGFEKHRENQRQPQLESYTSDNGKWKSASALLILL